jgi:hypothetical protein
MARTKRAASMSSGRSASTRDAIRARVHPDNSPGDETEDHAYSEQCQCRHRMFLSDCRRSVSARTRRDLYRAPHHDAERGQDDEQNR